MAHSSSWIPQAFLSFRETAHRDKRSVLSGRGTRIEYQRRLLVWGEPCCSFAPSLYLDLCLNELSHCQGTAVFLPSSFCTARQVWKFRHSLYSFLFLIIHSSILLSTIMLSTCFVKTPAYWPDTKLSVTQTPSKLSRVQLTQFHLILTFPDYPYYFYPLLLYMTALIHALDSDKEMWIILNMIWTPCH